MTGRALILGGNGRLGRHAAEALWNAGWQVRLFRRDTDDLDAEARKADVIVNGWNPAYPDWAEEVPRLTRAVCRAARDADATVVLPGNVYVYGAGAPPRLTAGTPHGATNPLGRIRIEMEAAYRNSGVRTILLRAGDFIDTRNSGNWFDKVIIAALERGIVTAPGNPHAPHAWAYLPDMAAAIAVLAERRAELPRFAEIAFPGHTLSVRDIAAKLSHRLGRPLTVRRMNWLPIHMLRPVWPLARHLCEMRYLWDMPHALDSAEFQAILPAFSATPPDEALAHAAGLAAVRPRREAA